MKTDSRKISFWAAFLHVFFALALLGAGLIQPQPAQASPASQTLADSYYYADGHQVALTSSAEWVALRFASDDPQQQAAALQDYSGLLAPLDQARQIPHPRLTLLPLLNGASLETVTRTVETMRASADILFVNPVFETPDAEMVLTDEFIASFPAEMSAEQIDALNAQYGVEKAEPILGQENTFVLRVTGAGVSALDVANRYQEQGLALNAAPNFVRLLNRQPASSVDQKPLGGGGLPANDPYYYDQWALENTQQYGPGMVYDADIDAQSAWGYTYGSPAVVIAVIDEGVDLSHEDLWSKFVPGYDATGLGSGGGPSGDDAHGTNVAGLAAATTDNALGVAGVCKYCRIMPVRIAYGSGGGWVTYDSWLANGITWAYQNGASILSNSWGGGSEATVINTAISNAKTLGRGGKGALVVFAAGNDNASSVSYPGYLSTVIAVGASNMCDGRKSPLNDLCNGYEDWWGSNYGSALDISAPGVWLDSTDIMGAAGYSTGNYYVDMNGTSGATPLVSGVLGLMLSVNPNLTAATAQYLLLSSADDVNGGGWDIYMGYGRLNAYRAVLAAWPSHAKFDFDGNKASDAAVYRPSTGTWYVRGVGSTVWGLATDVPVAADYNGDGLTDIAVFRPSTGVWYINGVGTYSYGVSTDILVPADYNGDGKAEIATFRPSTGAWYIKGVGTFIYGTSGDIPVPADYNGDGKAEVAIFRPSTSTWYIKGMGAFSYGVSGDVPVSADYNGDGKAEIAVFRPSTSAWYIKGVGSFAYGLSGDTPVPADYNGDGKTEAAVYRPSTHGWYIRGSGSFTYGIAGDIPIH